MKRFLLVAFGSVLIVSVSAIAQTQCLSNGAGGVNCSSPTTSSTQPLPNGVDGAHSYSPITSSTQLLPNGVGGAHSYSR